MNLNDLSDDCLLLIFDQFFHLEQFPTLSKVCSRWETLVNKRLKKVTHFDVRLHSSWTSGLTKKVHKQLTGKCILTTDEHFCNTIKLSEYLPNVKSIYFESQGRSCPCPTFARLLSNANPVDRLYFIYDTMSSEHDCHILENVDNLITPFLSRIQVLGTRFDLVIRSYFKTCGHLKRLTSLGAGRTNSVRLSHVLKFAESLTSLELLFTYCQFDLDGDLMNKIPIFGNLSNLMMENCSRHRLAFNFLNFCPNLVNLSLWLESSTTMVQIDEINTNHNLKGLSIHLFHNEQNGGKIIIEMIRKFPNCRYLHISGDVNEVLSIECIELLPNLLTLVIPKDYKGDSCRNRNIRFHCKKRNRKIDLLDDFEDRNSMMNNELLLRFQKSFEIKYSSIMD